MGILLALIPALTWGSLVLVSVKLGGNAYSQTLGITIGSLLFAIAMFFYADPELSPIVWSIGLVSGIFWTIGQLNQLASVKFIGVSKTVPISTGMQLVGTTLFGVLLFREWETKLTVILGSISIILIIIGVVFTSTGQKEDKNAGKSLKKGLFILFISSLGYIGYVIIIRYFEIDGWSAILPQALGMVIGASVLTTRHKPFNKYALKNIVTGCLWAAGNLGLLLSIPRVGVATSFSLSQTGIIISTLGGIFLLGEKKTKKQIIFVVIGCVLIIAGGVILGYTKSI
ncbi:MULTISPECIES: GRP family sugar transporter [Metabacillus]|uniref:Glucose transporter GlcU n=2 Tax=Metabacillus TaxID=2675233 RepID=A0A179SLW9_9BACI|nr:MULTISPECIES: GRP family sugar transporter [Metabacillus]OAS82636.1 glucose transporter GlcU [Metabacillus litoralis]QNF30819.1 glucose transporter GlcU [Metabacillus sp. KUDC1714]